MPANHRPNGVKPKKTKIEARLGSLAHNSPSTAVPLVALDYLSTAACDLSWYH